MNLYNKSLKESIKQVPQDTGRVKCIAIPFHSRTYMLEAQDPAKAIVISTVHTVLHDCLTWKLKSSSRKERLLRGTWGVLMGMLPAAPPLGATRLALSGSLV